MVVMVPPRPEDAGHMRARSVRLTNACPSKADRQLPILPSAIFLESAAQVWGSPPGRPALGQSAETVRCRSAALRHDRPALFTNRSGITLPRHRPRVADQHVLFLP